MKIAIASDHGGFGLKEDLKAYLEGQGHQVQDFGCFSTESCDYADFAAPAAKAVASGEYARGIVICTTGIGVSITANKIKGVRCALCSEPWGAEMTRRHNDANVLAIGAGATGPILARKIVDAFLANGFEGGRHQRRIDKIAALE